MTDREAALSGALFRACELVEQRNTDDYITERLIMDAYNLSGRQYAMIIRLARAGNACAKSFDFSKCVGDQDCDSWPELPKE